LLRPKIRDRRSLPHFMRPTVANMWAGFQPAPTKGATTWGRPYKRHVRFGCSFLLVRYGGRPQAVANFGIRKRSRCDRVYSDAASGVPTIGWHPYTIDMTRQTQ